MTPTQLNDFLDHLIQHQIKLSTMVWGPPGIGKSSIVAQVAHRHGIGVVDVRLSQLAPTDLRGLPVAENGLSKWFPPEFLPRSGKGVLFLDELNSAPPAMQGIAQQLILDRQVGSYRLPDGWYVWAAGNRKEDRAAVFDMPTPVANRFLHLSVEPDFDSFKPYALDQGLSEHIIAFLSFRPELLHKLDPHQAAWPSPRSWEMANALYQSGMEIAPAVGIEPSSEFLAFLDVYNHLPNLNQILAGQGQTIPFPSEPSVRYAAAIGLAVRATTAQQGCHAFQWLSTVAPPEWVQLFAVDLFRQMKHRGELATFAQQVQQDASLTAFLDDFQCLLTQ